METQVLQNVIVFIPDNFDAGDIFKNVKHWKTGKKYNITFKRNLTDSIHYLLHTIIQMETRRDKLDELIGSGFNSLHSDYLKKICGSNYKRAVDVLENHGVIAVNPSYQTGVKSKGYCLIGNYAAANKKEVQLSDEGGVKRRWIKWKEEQDTANMLKLDQIPFITKWYDKDRLTIEEQDAHHYAEFYRSMMIDRIPKGLNQDKVTNIENRINRRYNAAVGIISRIQGGDFNLTRSGEDNRLHSCVSNLMKEFRSFLMFDGQPLVGIDVKSSQPYLLTQLLKPDLYQESYKGLTIADLYPELHEALHSDPIFIHKLNSIIMSLTFSRKKNPSFERSFLNICWPDDFYSDLMRLEATMQIPQKDRAFLKRGKVKLDIMIAFYFKGVKKYHFKYWKRLESLYPIECKLIKFFDKLGRKHNCNFLPILLQRIESKLILDTVCYEIAKQIPDAPIIPIHDSILTTPSYVDAVEDIIKTTLYKQTGIEPGLKRDGISGEERLKELRSVADEDYNLIENSLSEEADKFTVHRKNPILYQIPNLDGKQIISSIYVDRTLSYDL